MYDLTTASWFSGVGGLDLGLHRAGWRAVSFSEIDPYASAVLAERWPGVPNLGDITAVASAVLSHDDERLQSERPRGHRGCIANGQPHGGSADDARGQAGGRQGAAHRGGGEPDAGHLADPDAVPATGHERRASGSAATGERASDGRGAVPPDWQHATLWTGGFPCQDLSIAGKRAGLAGGRSGLAITFLGLVGRHRPPAVLLENVPGLLSSNAGRDMGTLLRTLVELGYGVAYRVLDARYFGVPQRRRRVFILALHADTGLGADSAAAVLAVGARCERHPAKGGKKGQVVADRFDDGVGGAGVLPQAISAKWAKQAGGPAGDEHHNLVVAPTLRVGHSGGGSAHAVPIVVPPVRAGGHGDPGIGRDDDWKRLVLGASPDPGGVRAPDGLASGLDDSQGVVAYRKSQRAHHAEDGETWVEGDHANTVNGFDDGSDGRATHLVSGLMRVEEDPLLPLGLDSHRYRVIGNGVVAPVAQWIGERLAAELR